MHDFQLGQIIDFIKNNDLELLRCLELDLFENVFLLFLLKSVIN